MGTGFSTATTSSGYTLNVGLNHACLQTKAMRTVIIDFWSLLRSTWNGRELGPDVVYPLLSIGKQHSGHLARLIAECCRDQRSYEFLSKTSSSLLTHQIFAMMAQHDTSPQHFQHAGHRQRSSRTKTYRASNRPSLSLNFRMLTTTEKEATLQIMPIRRPPSVNSTFPTPLWACATLVSTSCLHACGVRPKRWRN